MSRKTDGRMSQAAPVGCAYYVSEEQLAQYAKLSTLERLTWLDQARQLILLAETEQTATRRARLRDDKAEFSRSEDALGSGNAGAAGRWFFPSRSNKAIDAFVQ